MGIARLSPDSVSDDLQAGWLVRLLADDAGAPADMVAIYPACWDLAPKMRASIDHLLERFALLPPWDEPEDNAAGDT